MTEDDIERIGGVWNSAHLALDEAMAILAKVKRIERHARWTRNLNLFSIGFLAAIIAYDLIYQPPPKWVDAFMLGSWIGTAAGVTFMGLAFRRMQRER